MFLCIGDKKHGYITVYGEPCGTSIQMIHVIRYSSSDAMSFLPINKIPYLLFPLICAGIDVVGKHIMLQTIICRSVCYVTGQMIAVHVACICGV